MDREWPRRLLSPKRVLFFIRDENALKALCCEDENKCIDMRPGNMLQHCQRLIEAGLPVVWQGGC